MKHLSYEERQEIMLFSGKGFSMRSIATMLERNVSTISREVKRNSVKGKYTAKKAQMKKYQRRKSCKKQQKKIRQHQVLEDYIRKKLERGWTPEQIAGTRNNQRYCVTISTISIYRYIYSIFGYGLGYYLLSQRHRPQKRKTSKNKKGQVLHRVWIDERPQHINNREEIGDREVDTIVGTRYDKECILTLVDRKSRYVVAEKMRNKKAESTFVALSSIVKRYKVQSLTFDNGHEFAYHYKLGLSTYFCHPYSSREKGQIEQVNKLIRRYIPKKAHISSYDENYIQRVVHVLNHTPRKCLGRRTPYEVYYSIGVAFDL